MEHPKDFNNGTPSNFYAILKDDSPFYRTCYTMRLLNKQIYESSKEELSRKIIGVEFDKSSKPDTQVITTGINPLL